MCNRFRLNPCLLIKWPYKSRDSCFKDNISIIDVGQLPETTIIDIALLTQPNVDFSVANVLDNIFIWSMHVANLAICIHLIMLLKRTKCKVWLCSYNRYWGRNYDIQAQTRACVCLCSWAISIYIAVFTRYTKKRKKTCIT